MSLCSWSAYDMHIQMAQIPFTSFTLQVLHAGIKSINVSVHACQCRHHNRHSESVQCTVTILFVSVTITYRHSESVQCSHHHVCVSITDRHSESVQCSHHHVCQCQHHRQALRVSSVQSPSCLSVSASQTGTQSQFSAVTIMSVSVSITDRHSESVQCSHHHVCQCQHHRQALRVSSVHSHHLPFLQSSSGPFPVHIQMAALPSNHLPWRKKQTDFTWEKWWIWLQKRSF